MIQATKNELLAIIMSPICPICWREKAAPGWTCKDCGRAHWNTPEHEQLAYTCSAHIEAADAYLKMIRKNVVR